MFFLEQSWLLLLIALSIRASISCSMKPLNREGNSSCSQWFAFIKGIFL